MLKGPCNPKRKGKRMSKSITSVCKRNENIKANLFPNQSDDNDIRNNVCANNVATLKGNEKRYTKCVH